MHPGSERLSSRLESAHPAPARRGKGVLGQDGFTLIEMVVGFTLLSVVLAAILTISGASWRTEVKAYTSHQVQWVARAAMNAIVNGDPNTVNPVHGLRRASAVVTNPGASVMAYRVTWTDSAGITHDQTVTYWKEDQALYRSINPYVQPLSPTVTNGTLVARGVTEFALSVNGAIPVEITMTVTHSHGASITLRTRVTPRNLDTGS